MEESSSEGKKGVKEESAREMGPGQTLAVFKVLIFVLRGFFLQ